MKEKKGMHPMAWKTTHENHSIERVRISFNFQESLPQKSLADISSFVKEKRESWGLNQITKAIRSGFQLQIDAEGNQQVRPIDSVKSDQFQKTDLNTNAVLETLHISPEFVNFEILDYAGWDDFIRRVDKTVINDVLSKILVIVDIESIGLEYSNTFIDNSANPENPFDILDIQHLLPEQAFKGNKGWHVNRGWFETVKNTNVLINQTISLDEIIKKDDNSKSRHIGIHTITKTQDKLPVSDIKDITSFLSSLHECSKGIFSNVLNDTGKSLVNLKGK